MSRTQLTVGSLKKQTVNSLTDYKSKAKVKGNLKDNKTVKYIVVTQNSRVYKIIPKEKNTLLDSALEQNQTLSYKCKKGTCGKCMVNVLNGKEYLKGTTVEEHKKLQNKINQGYRLACQTVLK